MSKKLALLVAILTAILLVYAGCGGNYPDDGGMKDDPYYNSNEYNEFTERPFFDTAEHATSSFSLFHSTASYSELRNAINNNYPIEKDMVRMEEMLNYFTYNYDEPGEGEDFAVTKEVMPSPWNHNTQLVSIGVKAREVDVSDYDSSNLVFLIDVSGSMAGSNRIGLLKQAFSLLVDNISNDDKISIVTYSSKARVLLEGESGAEKAHIKSIINSLSASGSTAGAQGIQTAYNLAAEYFIEGGNNRVILATDGDFNVGISSEPALKTFISEKRDTSVYLSILGFGYGNTKDNKMESLASAGNGNYAYIDTLAEAQKVLVEELSGTLYTVARDTKIQITFNPGTVRSYRLLGYENRMLTDEEFNDDTTDAGEIGSEFSVTAVYEVVLETGDVTSTMEDNYLKVTLRYKEPTTEQTPRELIVYASENDRRYTPSNNMLFQSSVIETALILRNSVYKGNSSYSAVLTRLGIIEGLEEDSYKAEFLSLVQTLKNRS